MLNTHATIQTLTGGWVCSRPDGFSATSGWLRKAGLTRLVAVESVMWFPDIQRISLWTICGGYS